MSRKKVAMGVTVVALVSMLVGVVWAQWLSTGTGSGQARATMAVNATVAPAEGLPDLYPGYTEGDVYFTITNPNPYDITFDTLEVSGAITSENGCPGNAITVDSPTTVSLPAPANSTTDVLSVDDIVSMSPDAPNECQGAAFFIPLTLTGQSSG